MKEKIKLVFLTNKYGEHSVMIDDRYEMFQNDGIVYDKKEGKDIPQWIFNLRDFCQKIGN